MIATLPPFGDRRHLRVGLLGGSFNPAHAGHLHISREALKCLELDQVWWLVSPQNPLKPAKGMADLAERLDLARARAKSNRRVIVTDVEQRIGTRRTYASLRLLKQRYPRIAFVWLMGADNLAQIPRWERWPSIFRSVRVAVFDRSPYSYRAQAGAAALRFASSRRAARKIWTETSPVWTYIAIRRHAATATAIRNSRATKTTRNSKGSPP